MSLQINNKVQGQSGFTIVELLIVIVIIAILAAITIVGYNGITARANSSSALAAAQGVAKKLEAYNAEESAYPPTIAALTGDSSKSYYITTGTLETATFNTKPSSASKVFVNRCGTGSATSLTTYTGAKVSYWKFDGATGIQTINVGDVGTVCLTAALNT